MKAPRKKARTARRKAAHKPQPLQSSKEARAVRQQAFLAAFVERGTVLAASQVAGIHRDTHYEWLRTDPDYAAAFQMAEEDAVQVLETEIRRRATVGVEEPVFHQGKIVGHIRKYSDTLAIFILKARRPEVYRDRFEGTIKREIDITDASPEELEAVRSILLRQAEKQGATR